MVVHPAFAYDCVPAIDQVDLIFKGKVREVLRVSYTVQEGSRRLPDQLARLEVMETYKGNPERNFDLYFYKRNPAGSSFSAGEEKWVYAKRDEVSGRNEDASCGITRAPQDLNK